MKVHVGRIEIKPDMQHGVKRVVDYFASVGGQICCATMKNMLDAGAQFVWTGEELNFMLPVPRHVPDDTINTVPIGCIAYCPWCGGYIGIRRARPTDKSYIRALAKARS